MAETNPLIEIALQNIRPVIEMVIEKSTPIDTPVLLVNAQEKKYYTSSTTTVIGPRLATSISFVNHVPEGYTCIGCRSAGMTYRSGANVVFGQVTTGYVVMFRNIGDAPIYAVGHDSGGYYCVYNATLICVKDGVLE